MKTMNIDIKKEPTDEQKRMLENMTRKDICFDEDCPELSENELLQFRRIADMRKVDRRKQNITLRVSPSTAAKAKALGAGYTGVLARMLDLCLNDPEIIKKCL